MKRALSVTAALVVALALAAPASSATPTEKRLQREINVLNGKVTKLQKRMANAELGIEVAILYTVCSNAVSADALQGTWTQFPSAGFPVEPAVDDYAVCSKGFKITRQPNDATTSVIEQVNDVFTIS